MKKIYLILIILLCLVSSAFGGPSGSTLGGGDVTGPASATDGQSAVYDGPTGKKLKAAGTPLPAGTLTNGKACTYNSTGPVVDCNSDFSGPATSETLTNKTLDVDGTGNVLKSWGYLILTHPHVCGSAAPMQTTSTTNTFGQCKFSGTVEDNNFAEYYLVVPSDIDTSVDLVATFKIKLDNTDTADHDYVISFDSVADSAAYAGSLGDPINLAYTADGSGAKDDVETAGPTTLTGWRSAMTAGQLFVIRITRDGDDETDDASTVASYSGPLVIKYKITQ
jgi:hypothetical protein